LLSLTCVLSQERREFCIKSYITVKNSRQRHRLREQQTENRGLPSAFEDRDTLALQQWGKKTTREINCNLMD